MELISSPINYPPLYNKRPMDFLQVTYSRNGQLLVIFKHILEMMIDRGYELEEEDAQFLDPSWDATNEDKVQEFARYLTINYVDRPVDKKAGRGEKERDKDREIASYAELRSACYRSFTKDDEGHENVALVYFVTPESDGLKGPKPTVGKSIIIEVLKDYQTWALHAERNNEHHPVRNLIVVSPVGLSPDANKELSKIVAGDARERDPKTTLVQVFKDSSLMYNPTKHEYVPKHIPLSRDEMDDFYRVSGIQAKNLPSLQFSDSGTVFNKYKRGDPIVAWFGWRVEQLVLVLRKSPSDTIAPNIPFIRRVTH